MKAAALDEAGVWQTYRQVVRLNLKTVYIEQLPVVRLANSEQGKIVYTLKEEAMVTEGGGAVINLDISNRIFSMRMLQPGCFAELTVNGAAVSGSLTEVEQKSESTYELTLTADTMGLPIGASAQAEITCEPVSFQYTIDRSLIFQSTQGQDVIYLVVQQDGPWAKQYILQESQIQFWLEENSETVALMLTEPLLIPSPDLRSQMYHCIPEWKSG